MTRKELAAFKRLDKRRDSLFTALCIIKTWLSFPDDTQTLYNIGQLVTERILSEQEAQRKEEARPIKATSEKFSPNQPQ